MPKIAGYIFNAAEKAKHIKAISRKTLFSESFQMKNPMVPNKEIKIIFARSN